MDDPPRSDGCPSAWRPTLLALVVTVLVASAGCAGIGGVGGSTNPPPQPTPAPTGTPTAPPSSPGSDSNSSHDATTTGSGAVGDGTDAVGKMTVVVGGEEVTEDERSDADRIRFDADAGHTWNATGNVTLAEALAPLGVSVGDGTLTYDGTTYDDSTNGTSVNVRVNGDPVEPTTYTLADGDEVWVTVETPEMDVSTPGEYIREDDQHIHGHLEFVVAGEGIDFGRDRYQSDDRYFHFEGGDAAAWHAHSYAITLQYALSSLDGIDVSADGRTVTVDGTTYRDGEDGTTITFEANGDPVDPGEYYLKDWDGVRVVVEDGA